MWDGPGGKRIWELAVLDGVLSFLVAHVLRLLLILVHFEAALHALIEELAGFLHCQCAPLCYVTALYPLFFIKIYLHRSKGCWPGIPGPPSGPGEGPESLPEFRFVSSLDWARQCSKSMGCLLSFLEIRVSIGERYHQTATSCHGSLPAVNDP